MRRDDEFPWWDPTSGIERAAQIVPLWVAESVQNEAEAWLRTAMPAEWPGLLAAKAERCFARHRQFHRLVCACGAGGNAGIANLRRFMRHWLSGRLARKRHALFRRLPHGFTLGLPLPLARWTRPFVRDSAVRAERLHHTGCCGSLPA